MLSVKSLIGVVLAPVMLVGLAPPAANAVSLNNDTVNAQSQSTKGTAGSNDAAPTGTISSNKTDASSLSPSTNSSNVPQQPKAPETASSPVSKSDVGTAVPDAKTQAANGLSGLTAQPASSPIPDNRNGAITQTKPSVGAQDAVPCTQKSNQIWGTTDPLHWNIHLSDDGQDCVLELEHGTIPETGLNAGSAAGVPPGSSGSSSGSEGGDDGVPGDYINSNPIPWKDATVTKLEIDAPGENGSVKLTNGWGLFDVSITPNLRTAEVGHLDTSKTTLMAYMFHGLTALTNVNGTEQWDTSKVTNMHSMFLDCTSLREIDISSWDMRGLTWLTGSQIYQCPASTRYYNQGGCYLNVKMFKNCPKLARIRVGKLVNFESSHLIEGGYTNYIEESVFDLSYWNAYYHPPFDIPAYVAADREHMVRGSEVKNVNTNEPTWIYKTLSYNGNGSGSDISSCAVNGYNDAVPTTPICKNATKAGSRLLNWNTAADGNGQDLPLKNADGSTATIPYPLPDGVTTLYAKWSTKPQPTIASHTVKADGVHLSGTIAGTIAAGDKLTVSDDDGQQSVPVTLAAGAASWNAVVPLPKDTVGAGGDVKYTAKITRVSNEDADDSAPYTATIDTVAPGVKDLKVDLDRVLSGTVQTSADEIAQPNRTFEVGDAISVKWPDNTTTTTGDGGAPLVSGSDGTFSVAAPAAMTSSGEVTVTVKDKAGTHGIEGADNSGVSTTNMPFTVHFDLGSGAMAGTGNVSTADQQVADGGHVTKPSQDPAPPAGYRFDGWYTDGNYGTKFDFGGTAINEDKTIYAKWVKFWEVTMEPNNGGLSGPVVVKVDDNGTVPEDERVAPSKAPDDRYGQPSVFRGWYKDGESESFDFEAPVTEAVTLTAKWADSSHKVTFDANGGRNAPAEAKVADHGKVNRPAAGENPTREGYRFDDWYTEATGGSAFNFAGTAIDDDITVYAHWVKTYVVTFDSAGGSDVAKKTVDAGLPVSSPADPTKTDSHGERARFLGWFAPEATEAYDFSASSVTADVTLTARWDDLHREVRFDTQGGPSIGHRLKDDGGTPGAAPADPVWAKHRFLGWFDAPTGGSPFDFTQTLHGDVTAYAHWTGTWDVTFDANGGDDVAKQEIDSGGTATDPGAPATPPTDNHNEPSRFLGWFADGSDTAYDFSTAVTGDVALKAKWDDAHREVRFDSHGGSNVARRLVNDGATPGAAPTAPTRANHRFLGWYTSETGGTPFDFTQRLHGDVTAHAHWVRQYTVTFNANGGSAVPEQTPDTGTSATDPGTPATAPLDSHNESSKFLGWFADGSDTAYDFSKPVTTDLALKAKWGDARHKITLDLGNDQPTGVAWVDDGTLLSASSLAVPVKTGYRFDDWYTIAPSSIILIRLRGAGAYDFSVAPTGDFTLYAHYVKTWNVTFDPNGGSVTLPAQTPDAGSLATDPGRPGTAPLDHHQELSTFKGWVVASTGETFDFARPVTADVALKAMWADAHHRVVFDSQGGSSVASQDVADGAKATEPRDPIRDGYRFDAWYTAASGGSKLDFGAAPTADVTVYARWVKTWQVTFDPAGGVGQPPAQIVDQGSKATRPAAGAVSREGYVLAGWLDAQGRDYGFDVPVMADMVLKAKWKVDKSALNALIDKAKGKDKSGYTPDTFKPLQDALDHAKNVSKDPDASKADVDQAVASLQDALNSLKPVDSGSNSANGNGSDGSNASGGLAGLNDLINQAASQIGNHKQSDYTPDSWEAFQDALNHAKAMARDPNASQSDIDQAAAALRNAMNGLKLRDGLSATGAGVVAPAVLAVVLTAFAGIALVLRMCEER
ncbi:InlB B-repeat-containing protein [Bifidobacterium sp. ESL0732]|uniref:InlB B-repeat-containing protein n=1 Tax=Bifidobacterium sp. ESL0732 TaxID=2983222 RepID=UPI0023F777C8|nr:InlB B-repeat-containing protein [Bifidobacterium sp. ESL0732]WEV63638.1 InlB B-repeat-containing protein [Bifidobacterium sp. ESL0732]